MKLELNCKSPDTFRDTIANYASNLLLADWRLISHSNNCTIIMYKPDIDSTPFYICILRCNNYLEVNPLWTNQMLREIGGYDPVIENCYIAKVVDMLLYHFGDKFERLEIIK